MTTPSLDYYTIEELLTDEERAARDRTRRFVQEEVMQEVVPCHRAAKFPEHLIPRMGALGFERQQVLDWQCLHRGCKSGMGERRRRSCWRICSRERRRWVSRERY